ncbi:Uncharacterised protein [Burkholderia pseudomallei]|nr:Uncharacterised protein [Burkholderia pseudomallei]CAJ6384661.1 Uncharacterised protein [Burkholderia pseudomallei]
MDAKTIQETLELVKGQYGLGKTITTANNLVAYDLQAPAKNLYPVVTPIRNKMARVPGKGGVATNWRTVKAIVGSGYDSSPWVPEGQRSGRMSYNTAPVAANYVTIGEEDGVTFEAEHAGEGFEDVKATMAMRLLQKTMLKEENAILGGNNSLALGVPTAPTLSAAGSGATLPAATYSVIVVALTLEGFINSSVSNGVATQKTVTGADGQTYVVTGGSSNQSSNTTQAVTLGQTLSATVPVVTGAVAYAWYVGTAGSEKLQAITTINSATFSAPLSSSTQAATAITADNSTNPLAFDGLLTTAFKPANGAYVKVMPTGTAGTGTPLTASGRGSVVEIDTMLKSMWDTYQLGATVLYVNSQEQMNITNKVLNNSSGPLLRYNQPAAGKEPYALVASGVVTFYFNPFTANGGQLIPVMLHPRVPPGTIVAWCEELPLWYQNNEVSNVAEIHCRKDYYQLDFPIVTRMWQSGVYAEEVLAVYAPFAMAIITNIAAG